MGKTIAELQSGVYDKQHDLESCYINYLELEAPNHIDRARHERSVEFILNDIKIAIRLLAFQLYNLKGEEFDL